MLVATQEMIQRLQDVTNKCYKVARDANVVANLHNDIPTHNLAVNAQRALDAVKSFQVDLEELMRKP